jgi:hypothetical protein
MKHVHMDEVLVSGVVYKKASTEEAIQGQSKASLPGGQQVTLAGCAEHGTRLIEQID